MSRVIFICVLIFTGAVFAKPKPIELEISPSTLFKMVSNGQTTSTLPEFEVFNSEGLGVFHQKSLDKQFKQSLVNAITNPKINGNKLEDSLKVISDKKNEVPYQVDPSKYDYIFVEYWASWCAPCFHQMAKVEEVITENPNIKTLWLKVERDPTKIDGATRVKNQT
jgi:thiol-disulfide isomerase/thioredoxin